jgi:hypothetical protein
LVDLGVVEWVPHLVESDEPDAEIIHSVHTNASDTLEFCLGDAAEEAGLAMLNDELRAYSVSNGLLIVPVLRHFVNVQMVGIARLRYRPHTKLTAAWWKQLNTKGEKYLAQYKALADSEWPT